MRFEENNQEPWLISIELILQIAWRRLSEGRIVVSLANGFLALTSKFSIHSLQQNTIDSYAFTPEKKNT